MKKIDVVELNKEDKKIILEENNTPLIIFIRKWFWLVLLILLLLFIIPLLLFIKNINFSNRGDIQQVPLSIEPGNLDGLIVDANNPLTDDDAIDYFTDNDLFSGNGEIFVSKIVENSNYIIKFFSDGTALKTMVHDGFTTRIMPSSNGGYCINENGVISKGCKYQDISIISEKNFSYGNVIYYSDGSSEIINSKFNIFVRNSHDIYENYISSNKVSYLKNSQNVGGNIVNYYFDGTIVVVNGSDKRAVRNESDILIKDNKIVYLNNNEARIIKSVKYSDQYNDNRYLVEYYSDGSAIIYDGNNSLSVRKSNSIHVLDNKLVEIIDNDYVTISDLKDNGNILYYSNGSAVFNYGGIRYYCDENSNIKYDNNVITKIDGDKEKLSSDSKINDIRTQIFDKTAVIDGSDYTMIVPKNKVIFNSDGSFKEILKISDTDVNKFTVSNNTDKDVKYRVVIERSDRSTFDSKYIKYRLKANDKLIDNKYLIDNIWEDDSLKSNLSAKGTNYILIDDVIKANSSVNIRLLIWSDYENMGNDMQDKYFYGTLKLYSWIDK